MAHSPEEALDARNAAELLGVKVETLYAYVSRGLLSSREGGRGRARRYRRADVEALRQARGRRATAPGPLRLGESEAVVVLLSGAGVSWASSAGCPTSRNSNSKYRERIISKLPVAYESPFVGMRESCGQ